MSHILQYVKGIIRQLFFSLMLLVTALISSICSSSWLFEAGYLYWRGNQEWTVHRHWQMYAHNTQDDDKQTIAKHKKTITMNPAKQRGWTHVFDKGKQCLPCIRHLPCYSYVEYLLVQLTGLIINIHSFHIILLFYIPYLIPINVFPVYCRLPRTPFNFLSFLKMLTTNWY